MKLLLCISLVLVAVSGDVPEYRIVNGKDASISKYPYYLAVEIAGSVLCGATLIEPKLAISAAHCFYYFNAQGRKRFTVRAGSNISGKNGQVVKVKDISINKDYVQLRQIYDSDIALLKLEKAINPKFGKPIPIAGAADQPKEGDVGVVVGLGLLEENGEAAEKLQVLEVPVNSYQDCKKAYPSITPRQFCAGYLEGGKGTCLRDTGGGLVINNKLVGVVSTSQGCARPGYPTVYTNVAKTINQM